MFWSAIEAVIVALLKRRYGAVVRFYKEPGHPYLLIVGSSDTASAVTHSYLAAKAYRAPKVH
jgi:hypothetical protein